MHEGGNHVLEDDPIRDTTTMTAQGVGGIDHGVHGQQDHELSPDGLKERYWQGGHGILQ